MSFTSDEDSDGLAALFGGITPQQTPATPGAAVSPPRPAATPAAAPSPTPPPADSPLPTPMPAATPPSAVPLPPEAVAGSGAPGAPGVPAPVAPPAAAFLPPAPAPAAPPPPTAPPAWGAPPSFGAPAPTPPTAPPAWQQPAAAAPSPVLEPSGPSGALPAGTPPGYPAPAAAAAPGPAAPGPAHAAPQHAAPPQPVPPGYGAVAPSVPAPAHAEPQFAAPAPAAPQHAAPPVAASAYPAPQPGAPSDWSVSPPVAGSPRPADATLGVPPATPELPPAVGASAAGSAAATGAASTEWPPTTPFPAAFPGPGPEAPVPGAPAAAPPVGADPVAAGGPRLEEAAGIAEPAEASGLDLLFGSAEGEASSSSVAEPALDFSGFSPDPPAVVPELRPEPPQSSEPTLSFGQPGSPAPEAPARERDDVVAARAAGTVVEFPRGPLLPGELDDAATPEHLERPTTGERVGVALALLTGPLGLILAFVAAARSSRRRGWVIPLVRTSIVLGILSTIAAGIGGVAAMNLIAAAQQKAALTAASADFCAAAAADPALVQPPLFGWPARGSTIPASLEAMQAWTQRWTDLAATSPAGLTTGLEALAKAGQDIVDSVTTSRTIDIEGNEAVIGSAVARSGVADWYATYCVAP